MFLDLHPLASSQSLIFFLSPFFCICFVCYRPPFSQFCSLPNSCPLNSPYFRPELQKIWSKQAADHHPRQVRRIEALPSSMALGSTPPPPNFQRSRRMKRRMRTLLASHGGSLVTKARSLVGRTETQKRPRDTHKVYCMPRKWNSHDGKLDILSMASTSLKLQNPQSCSDTPSTLFPALIPPAASHQISDSPVHNSFEPHSDRSLSSRVF